jgi:ketosteroid isomerase-like protein
MSKATVDVVRAAWEAWERGDMDAVFATYDPGIVWDQTHAATAELSGVYRGHDGVRDFFRAWLAPFDGYYGHADEFIDAGDSVVATVRQGGRGKESGAEVEMCIWQVYRVRDGLIVEITPYETRAEALGAVGLSEQAS